MQNLRQVQHSEQAKSPQADLSQFEITKGIYTSGMLKTLKISPCSKLVLIAISQHFPQIFPSLKYLAEQLGISESSVKNAIKELRNAGLILYTLDRVNHYKFTQKFFDLVNITPEQVKNYPGGSQILPTNKQEQKKNKGFKNFSNFRTQPPDSLPKYHHNTHITGITYKKYEPEQQTKKESPLDLSREQAIDFLENLPQRMKNTYFATELRKKWNL